MDAIKNIPTEPDSDFKAIIDHLMTGKPLDPELRRRVHERSERATQELFEKHGYLNVAVDLIREIRGPLGEAQERELTLAQRDLLRDSVGPPRLLNPDTNETYVLLSEEEYDRLRGGDR